MNRTTLTYRPQLDALRALAVGVVLLQHFWLNHNVPTMPPKGPVYWCLSLPWGIMGVQLFFVLSGFLITQILLSCRETADRFTTIRQFYLRRFLRIFPIYYLTIAVALWLNIDGVRTVWLWLVTYTSNWHRGMGCFGHFWSLAVEEQFYLIWPWVMLWLPARWLLPTSITLTLLAPCYRVYAVWHDFSLSRTIHPTIGCCDALGMGAILAILAWSSHAERVHRLWTRWVLPVGLLGMIVSQAAYCHHGTRMYLPVFYFVYAMVAAWLVSGASRGFRSGFVFDHSWLRYLGKISYGIYVYHGPIMPLSRTFSWPHYGSWPTTMVLAALTVGVASLSWFIIERPCQQLKRLIPYL